MKKKSYPRMHGALPRHKICLCGKVSFDKKGAQTKRNILLKQGNVKYLRIYQCHGSVWHITKERHWDGE